ncbi:tRNA pseudouridine(55) synthase TruB [Candidatus Gracilibacteria bacterium CG17_big_fil_post_rev_8_21_14_2_50_48_13]|nr:MAG: tRNA pseudouridine(55) synthase TruB [Candidatus Gracilibacteria bacterium CG17_big_fil_post_rev_8_21_14_2_50_48_13]
MPLEEKRKPQPKKLRQKNKELPLGGILVIDKPAGLSSHDIVGRLKLYLNISRIGHAGTLDPFATGVLLVCVGRATRLVPWLTAVQKRYTAKLVFGMTSTTDDTEGECTKTGGTLPTLEEVKAILPQFQGTITQRPPIFSAIRVEGRRAYKIARGGRVVEMPERTVEILHLDILGAEENDEGRLISLDLDVTCGSGTYIRSLARDIGEALGSGAYLGALRRTAVGEYGIDEAIAMKKERNADDGATLLRRVIPAGLARINAPAISLDATESARFLQGQRLAGRTEPESESMAIRDPKGHLLGFAAIRGEVLHPLVVLG